MGIEIAIAAAGLAISAAGAATSYIGQRKAAEAQAEAAQIQLEQQKKLEAQRKLQMDLEAARLKRENVRKALAARSQAIAMGTMKGVATEGSSALPGAFGSISGREGSNELALSQNQEIGGAMFDINQQAATQLTGVYRQAASGTSMAALGGGLGSLGNAVMSNSGQIVKIGSALGSAFNPATA